MVLRPQDRERGLEAVNQSRAVRRRALVVGRVPMREVATRFWLATFAGLIVFGVVYYRYAQSELADQKSALAARQRAVALAVGADAAPLRDKLEAWVLALARAAPDQSQIAPDISLDDISRGPGVYLRLSHADAGSVEAIRRATRGSLRDGFTACLFVGRAGDPRQGVSCQDTSPCGPGELCNDWGVCAPPSQPYHLELLNQALHVVEPHWLRRLEGAGSDLEVLALELDLEDAAKHEVPAAVELVKRSKFFTVLLDEPSEGGLAALPADAGVTESAEERLQTADHFVRIGIWDIERGAALAQLRLEAAGRFLSMGKRMAELSGVRAEQRQANNCALAMELREQITGRAAGQPAPLDSGSGGDRVAGE